MRKQSKFATAGVLAAAAMMFVTGCTTDEQSSSKRVSAAGRVLCRGKQL